MKDYLKQRLLYNIFLSLVGIVLGIIFCVINPDNFLKTVFTFIGIFIVVTAVFSLLTINYQVSTAEKNYSFINGIISLIIGILLIIFHHTIATIIAGSFLIIMPIYRIIISNDKLQTLKNELFKLILGLILIICGVGKLTKILFYIIGSAIIAFSVVYMFYNIINYFKIGKSIEIRQKKKEENDVIDV